MARTTGLRRGLFATRADFTPGFQHFEQQNQVVYVQAGLFESPEPKVTTSALDLPYLGHAQTGDMASEPRYLVMSQSLKFVVREVPQRSGGLMYAVDQMACPDSVVFCPGGLHADRVIISGEIAAIGATADSRSLFSSMLRDVTAGFRRLQSYWVGPEAFRLFSAGHRLTRSAKAPVKYDLALPSG